MAGADTQEARYAAAAADYGAALERLAVEATGSSQSPRRAMLLTEPPAIDANEITDKGYINQGAVLARRGALVERLYEQPVSADVLIIPGR